MNTIDTFKIDKGSLSVISLSEESDDKELGVTQLR